MAKGKSSASSATRKKHARKAAGPQGAEEHLQVPTKEKKTKGKKSKEPRKKVYIPPVKPAPVQPDPLDTLGIAQRISAELLVVLRKLAKKDQVTKRRALEDLQADWLEKAKKDGDVLSQLVEALPVWLHHVPSLFLHPSRRIRLLSISLHLSLLNLPNPVAEQTFFFLREVADSDQAEYVIGSWSMAAHDADRQVSTYARKSWDRFVTVSGEANGTMLVLDEVSFARLWDFTQRVLLDPSGVYSYVNPPQSVVPASILRRSGGRSAPAAKKEEDTPRSRGEEEEENDRDRKARLRISGFGAAEWILNAHSPLNAEKKAKEEFLMPLDNLALWTALYHGEFATFVHDELESFGLGQPGVRRAAWTFLQALLRRCQDSLQTIASTLSVAVLRSAWVEPDVGVRNSMWVPLLTFLKGYPHAWEIEASSDDDNDVDEDSEDEDDAGKIKVSTLKNQVVENKIIVSHAYEEFRQFLELGCMGSPVQGYPAVVIVLSTIPPSILSSVPAPIQNLFTSFWRAIDGRALSGLDRTAASAAFLSSVLECTVFILRRLLSDQGPSLLGPDDNDQREAAHKLLDYQMKKVWEELCSGSLKVEEEVASASLAETLSTLYEWEEDLFNAAWNSLDSTIKAHLNKSGQVIPSLVPVMLKAFRISFPPGTHPASATGTLTTQVIHTAIAQFEQLLGSEEATAPDSTRLESLVTVLDTFGEELFEDKDLTSAIDNTCLQHTYRLLTISPATLIVYLSHRNSEECCLRLWRAVLRAIAEHPEELFLTLSPLLVAAERHHLSKYLQPSEDELDGTISQLLVIALDERNNTESLKLLQQILTVPDHFISSACLHGLVSTVCETFSQHVQSSLHSESPSTKALDALLSLLNICVENRFTFSLSDEELLSLFLNIFLFANVVPLLEVPTPLPSSHSTIARHLWTSSLSQVTDNIRTNAAAIVKQELRDLLLDCSIRLRPAQLIHMLSEVAPDLETDVIKDILPQQAELDVMLDRLPPYPADASLAVVDPLVLPGDWSEAAESEQPEYDFAGYSAYTRATSSMLVHFLNDRLSAKANVWALRHLLALSLFAQELLHISSAQSPAFSSQVDKADLEHIVAQIRRLTTYLLSHTGNEGWLSQVADNLVKGKIQPNADGVEHLLHALIRSPKNEDNVRESRILHIILQHLLASASKSDADQFVQLARTIERKAPHASLAIVLSVTRYAPEPPKLDRYRNELAANMLGVGPSKANTEGIWLLRRLAATAPDPESDIVYLPTPRAVNLMKACQQWITSDEDLDEEVECEMTSVFLHLAPILQNVPGSHWDLIFDVMENNLENASLDESSTLPCLAMTLKLLIIIQDLASTNKSLRAQWDERKIVNLVLVRDLAAKKLDSQATNAPLSVCRELALTIVQDLPESLIDENTLSKMCHLVNDTSDTVQRMAYKMLRDSAAKRTEYLVLEAGVDSEATVPLDLPLELVLLLQESLHEDTEDVMPQQSLLGYLLAWMLTFDLFKNASLKVIASYTDHLRRTGLITDLFLPQIFSILGLHGGIIKAFKLDIWAIDEYYLDLYTADSAISVPLLAAHLYYRALLLVPSLIRGWLLDCRDRQLSAAVATYTSTHFSPAIIDAELGRLKDQVVSAELADDNMKIKVAHAVHEVTAAYLIDEYELELKLRMPADWPLHTIEVKDTKRIGVTEDRWRSWVLGVQQILTFRGGSIADGLAFFKKNVTSHFEGRSECAICYSMISAMDSSLPKIPCKTCKNRFHAGCLYKWFSTSHSSSCPMCRSEIIH